MVNLDLNNNTLQGNVTINSATEGIVNVSSGTINGKLIINTPNTTVNNYSMVKGVTTIKDVSSNTFNNLGILQDIIIEDVNSSSFCNKNHGKINGKIRITEKTSEGLILKGKIDCEVSVEAQETKVKVEKGAEIANLVVTSPKSILDIEGNVAAIKFNKEAVDSKLIVEENSIINAIQVDSKPTVSGKGIKNLSKDKITGQASQTIKKELEVNGLTSINTASKETMGKVLVENAKILNLDLSQYDKLINKQAVNHRLVKGNFANKEAMQKAINDLVKEQQVVEKEMHALTAINTASKETMGKVLVENAKILKLDLSDYSKLINKQAVNHSLVKRQFVNKEAIQKAINDLVKEQQVVEKEMHALTAINTASKETMGKVLVENAKILKLDLSNYDKLTNKEIVNYSLAKRQFANKEAIQEELNKLVKNMRK